MVLLHINVRQHKLPLRLEYHGRGGWLDWRILRQERTHRSIFARFARKLSGLWPQSSR